MAPLAGITVVEAANYIAGPVAALVLADLGADVIKVEPPRGDPYRRVGRAYGGSSLQFRAANQNKRSLALDLKSEPGMEEFKQLLAGADVLVTNWRPGVAERMGITAEFVRSEFPNLIWVRVSGYGPDGPRATQPAYDKVIEARAGGRLSASSEPQSTNNNVADKVSAMFAAQTITAALFDRTRTGTGAVCDVAMVDAMAYFYAADISAGHRVADTEPDESVARSAGADLTVATADGHMVLSPVTGAQMRRSLEAAGVPELFASVMEAPRSDTLTAYFDAVGPALLAKTSLEWEAIFAQADVPAAAVQDFSGHMSDPQTIHNQTYRRVPDASLDGDWLMVRFPALFDGDVVETAELAPPEFVPPTQDQT